MSIPAKSTVFYTPQLRELWPTPLAQRWAKVYPQVFDEDDLRITRHQPKYHFREWLAAVYLLHRDGALCLVEKYIYDDTHPRKAKAVQGLLTQAQLAALRRWRKDYKVQPPDLLVYSPDWSSFWFAEIKGRRSDLGPNSNGVTPRFASGWACPWN